MQESSQLFVTTVTTKVTSDRIVHFCRRVVDIEEVILQVRKAANVLEVVMVSMMA